MKTRYKYMHAVLTLGNCKFHNFDKPNHKFSIDTRESLPPFTFTFFDISRENYDLPDEFIYVEIYKRGNQVPLLSLKKGNDSPFCDITFDLGALLKGEEISGVYSVVFRNITPENMPEYLKEGDDCFLSEFSILDEKDMLEPPAVKLTGGMLSTFGDEIQLIFKTPRNYKSGIVVGAGIFTSSLRKMGSQELISEGKGKLSFSIKSPYFFTDDTYSCILSFMGKPFLKLEFVVKNGIFSIIGEEPLPKDTFFHYFTYNLEDFFPWNYLEGGILRSGHLRRKIYDNYGHIRLNDIRMKNKLARIEVMDHLLIVDSNSKEASGTLENYCDIMYPSTKFVCADCEVEVTETNLSYYTIPLVADKNFLCLTNISHLTSGRGADFMNQVKSYFANQRENVLCLIGTKSEITAVIARYPWLESLFTKESWIFNKGVCEQDFIHFIQSELRRINLNLTFKAIMRLINIYKCHKSHFANFYPDDYYNFLENNILKNYTSRVFSHSLDFREDELVDYIQSVHPEDIQFEPSAGISFTAAVEELDQMVGLDGIKDVVRKISSRLRYNQILQERALPSLPIAPQHMIFTGNPGTGKTTVAKKIGKIFHTLGLLSKGDVLVTERKDIVGRYLGDTENNMADIIKKARGGVLFIDEAYNLCTDIDDKRDYGKRVLESLLTLLAQDNSDILVILAGYGKQMQDMLNTNPGLEGRFPNHIHFNDYSPDELFRIGSNHFSKLNLTLSNAAADLLMEYICKGERGENFSNARWVIGKIENEIIPAMATRVMEGTIKSDADAHFCTLVEPSDIVAAFVEEKSIHKLPLRPRIGFRA